MCLYIRYRCSLIKRKKKCVPWLVGSCSSFTICIIHTSIHQTFRAFTYYTNISQFKIIVFRFCCCFIYCVCFYFFPPQIHILESGEVRVFSRNQEDNTSKYPDIISRIPKVKHLNTQSAAAQPLGERESLSELWLSNEGFYSGADNNCTHLFYSLCLSFSLFFPTCLICLVSMCPLLLSACLSQFETWILQSLFAPLVVLTLPCPLLIKGYHWPLTFFFWNLVEVSTNDGNSKPACHESSSL